MKDDFFRKNSELILCIVSNEFRIDFIFRFRKYWSGNRLFLSNR